MRILPDVLKAVRHHGEATYPEECCGFLLGRIVDGENQVVAAHRAENQREENRERRYQITPADYLAASKRAEAQGLEIVGFYHSHPDHPAQPSQTDLEEATFPGFVYVIVSILNGVSDQLTGWTLAPDRSRFLSEPVKTESIDNLEQIK